MAANPLSDLLAEKARATAEGDASRFRQIQVEYAKAPEVTRQRMYLETMQQIYANTTKIMVDAKGQGNLLYLPLDKIIQQTQQGATAPAAAAAAPAPAAAASTPAAPADARTRESSTTARSRTGS